MILFFLLSGYLIFRSVEREPTSTFLSRRMFKIFPAYSVNVALIFALGYFNSDHANWNLKLFLANLFMVQDVFGQELLNGVYWTLLIEIKFYVFLAFQYLLLRDRGTVAIMVGLVALNVAIWWTRGYASLLLTFFPTFYVGIQIYRAQRSNWDLAGVLTLAGSVALVAFSLFLLDQHFSALVGALPDRRGHSTERVSAIGALERDDEFLRPHLVQRLPLPCRRSASCCSRYRHDDHLVRQSGERRARHRGNDGGGLRLVSVYRGADGGVRQVERAALHSLLARVARKAQPSE